ncbi:MAG: M20/M25/M40 family metallo-hydrolase [Bacillota bacterium]
MSAATVAEEAMVGLVDEIRHDTLGSVIGFKKGDGPGIRPKVMLAGHMDEIGLMVTKIEEKGFLRFMRIGGVDPRILPGHEVIVYGKRALTGLIGVKPPHLTPPHEASKAQKMEDLAIDLGMPEDEVRKAVTVGDIVTFKRQVTELMGDALSGKSMDDRAGVAVILVAMDELAKYKCPSDVYAVATVQEETGFGGGIATTYGIAPDIGIAIDVCHAETPGVPEWRTAVLGKGPVIALGGNIHPKIYAALDKAAKDLGMTPQLEPAPGATGTDAWPMQMSRSGVATGLISIPLRYMHTSVETLSVGDVEKSGKLLAKFIASVDAAFVKELTTWS